jgi:RES domain-containing protein
MTLCGYDVDCEDILDLTDEAVRSAHGVRLSDLDCAWKDLSARRIEPPSWATMKRLTAAGVAGIIVPSFAIGATGADINAICWKWSGALPYQVKVVDDGEWLPKNISAWR